MTKYTQKQLDYLCKNRALPRSLLTTKFNDTFKTNKTRVSICTLCKKNVWLTGRTGSFKKNHSPWNKGTIGICKANSGSFQKENLPKNWRPVGSERGPTQKDYIYVKVKEKNIWKMKHIIIWEQKHGKVKKGHVIRFKDNNRLNCSLDNLEEVNRQVHYYLNNNDYMNLPAKLKPTMKAIAMIITKIGKTQRQNLNK